MSGSTTLVMLATAALFGTSVAHPPHEGGVDGDAVWGAIVAQQGQAITPPIRECLRRPAIAGPRASWAAGVRRVDELARYQIKTPTKVWDVRPSLRRRQRQEAFRVWLSSTLVSMSTDAFGTPKSFALCQGPNPTVTSIALKWHRPP
jgi:hypothetical protein